MTIETKFKTKEKVFVIEDNKIIQGAITQISISIDGDSKKIIYSVYLGVKWNNPWFTDKEESEIFKTKEEVIEYLRKN